MFFISLHLFLALERVGEVGGQDLTACNADGESSGISPSMTNCCSFFGERRSFGARTGGNNANEGEFLRDTAL